MIRITERENQLTIVFPDARVFCVNPGLVHPPTPPDAIDDAQCFEGMGSRDINHDLRYKRYNSIMSIGNNFQ